MPSAIDNKSSLLTDPYLQFQVHEHDVLLPMTHIKEVFTVRSDAVTAMPNLSAHVLGLLNRRSRILWLVDLAWMLGFSPLGPNHRQYTVILIEADGALLGLAVQAVRGVQRTTAQIQSPTTEGTTALTTCLRGYADIKAGSPALVLDPEALVHLPARQDD